MAFQWPLRVYIEDTDFGGIVYYVNYLKFMERARTEALREAGFSQQILADSDVIIVVQNIDCQYLKPARLDDELIIRSSIEEIGAATAVFRQEVLLQGTDEPLCSGTVRLACVSKSKMKPVRWPKAVRQALMAD